MLRTPTIFCAWFLFLTVARAQVGFPEAFHNDLQRALGGASYRSLSDQFVIRNAPRNGAFPIPLSGATNIHLVRLEPSLLAMSCEKIKTALLKELGMRDDWRGKRGRISLELHPAASLDETIIVASVQYPEGWSYQMALPDTLDSRRLVSAVVEVLLLEMANRNAPGRSAEIPAWLTEGLAQQLILNSQADLVLEPPSKAENNGVMVSRTMRDWQRVSPLKQAHDELHASPPLTLEELSWPQEGQLEGRAGEAYRNSAQLFVYELTHLKNGRACLRQMVEALPRHLNWQMSFFDAFHSYFASQLELEKWWALRLVSFTGRDLSQTWPADESWRKLDEIVRPPVQVRTRTDELPLRTEVTLQTILGQWDFQHQTKILQEKIQQLFLLRLHISQDLVYLVDEYRQVLDGYLKNREKAGFARTVKGQSGPGLDRMAQESIRELDALDARREELRPRPEASPPTRIDTVSADAIH